MSGGGTTVSAPVPSPEERALQSEQTSLLRDQRDQTQQMMQQQQMLAPVLYKQMGIQPQYDGAGHVTGYTQMPDDPQQAAFKQLQTQTMQQALDQMNDPQQKQINSLLKTRTLDALQGNLPVDPGLERNITEGRNTLAETLRNNMGSGYETSTPGIQALAEYDKRGNELRYGARTGQLTLAEQLQGANQNMQMNNAQMALPGLGLQNQINTSNLGGALGISGVPNTGIASLGNTASGFGNALGWYGNQRNMDFQSQVANANSANQRAGSMGALFGTGLMAAAYASDRRLKTKVKRIGYMPSGLPVYSYIIFGQPDVGVMADEVRAIWPEAVHTVQGMDVVDYHRIH